jgi:transposase
VLPPRQYEKLAAGTEDKEHAMSQKLNSEIAVVGIDIGKNSFHVVGHDRRGAIVLRQRWSRGQVETRLANLPPCLIGWRPVSARIISVASSGPLATTPG